MKLTIEPTGEFQRVVMGDGPRADGQECRIWHGLTDAGVEVKVWVAVVQPQTHDAAKLATFDAELRAVPKAERQLAVFDLRLVL